MISSNKLARRVRHDCQYRLSARPWAQAKRWERDCKGLSIEGLPHPDMAQALLVAARALQGFGAAFAVAGTLAAVTEAVPEAGRAGAISSWTGFLMLGFSLGSLIGGVVTHYAG